MLLKKNKNLSSNVFARVSYKLKFYNTTEQRFLLSIDLLKASLQQDLFYITIRNIEKTYSDLFQYPNPNSVINQKGKILFLQTVQNTCEDFLTKTYGQDIRVNPYKLKNSLYLKYLLEDIEILFQVPLSTLNNPKAAEFCSVYAPVYAYASNSFIDTLIENLIIEIANAVVYFNFVNYSVFYTFRQTLYKTKFLSLRDFERFKNNLIWKLRIKKYIQRPTDLYNSRYRLFVFRTTGIYSRMIYANRSPQLNSLSKLPLITVSFIELADFFKSRLEETFFIIRKGVKYILTSVLGQFIGLVWRGIIEALKK